MIKKKTIEVFECRCDICGFVWTPFVKIPKVCVKCKGYNWNYKQDEKSNKRAGATTE